MPAGECHLIEITKDEEGARLDAALSLALADTSRSYLQKLIADIAKSLPATDPESLRIFVRDNITYLGPIWGGDDPVGNYGAGVRQTGEEFKKSGMQDVTVRLFPLCRHEILNEINREEIYKFVSGWICEKIKN